MEGIIVAIFIVGYILIALEHPIRINKTAIALLTGVLCWTLFILSGPSATLLNSEHYGDALELLQKEVKNFSALSPHEIHAEYVIYSLGHHLNEIAQILFFLMGAMTIVELIDAHNGFRFITDRIKTRDPKTLLWIICGITFLLSAVLDNLTTTIVMVSLIRKIIPDKEMRLFFAGMIIIAANAGGAWSPIGDVTTTMLWIGGQLSATAIMKSTFIPSLACMLVPLLYLSFTLKGSLGLKEAEPGAHPPATRSNLVLFLGLGVLIAVPVFKTLTHLPPYLGMMLGLGIIWVILELIHPIADETGRRQFTAAHALSRIDMPSVLFFLGILLAVGALQAMSLLGSLAAYLQETIGDDRIIITLIGVLSSIVDNVPLVAASMGMYSLEQYPMDHMIWEYLAYCAGTGGSILVIGSAAGVAAMGIEKIDFIWYLKRISLLALMGYFAGAAVYLLMQPS
jgi:Na+/H+ antiporter NhaD/arsenite permease-like protein